MGQIRVDVSSFSLLSTCKCYKKTYVYVRRDTGVVSHTEDHPGWSSPTTASNTVRFDYSLPDGAYVTGAKVYATLGSPLGGSDTSTINGESVGTAKAVSVDVEVDPSAGYVEVPFVFRCNQMSHGLVHTYGGLEKTTTEGDDTYSITVYWYPYQHESSLSYDNVYLLIDYEGGDDTGGGEGPGEGDGSGGTDSGPTVGKLTVTAGEVSLQSKYTCITELREVYLDSGPDFVAVDSVESYSTTPNYANTTLSIDYYVPHGAVVRRAYICATVSGNAYDADTLTVNGVTTRMGARVTADVTISPGGGTLNVPFSFRAKEATHNHHNDGGTLLNEYWSYPYDSQLYSQRYRKFGYNHIFTATLKDVQLIIEYEASQGAVGWALDKTEVEAGDAVTLSLTGGADDYDRIVQVTLGGTVSEYTIPAGQTALAIDIPMEWLEEMPASNTGAALVTVAVCDAESGEKLFESSDNLTIVCPFYVIPTFKPVLNRLHTVGDVTYPDVTGGYVQMRTAFEAGIENAAGAYGSYVVWQTIEALGLKSDGPLVGTDKLYSGWIDASGTVSVRYTVMDSRGRTTVTSQTIIVEPYAPPAGTLHAWRVNEDGAEDIYGARVAYTYTATHHPLGGKNPLAVTLTADGATATNPPGDGLLFPAKVHTFDPWEQYTVDLVLEDSYGQVTYTVPVLAADTTTVVIKPPKRREKRRVIFGDYDTADHGKWTLGPWSFTEPEQQTNFVTVPGRAEGPLDMSTALTNGVPTYGSRQLTVELEGSEGTRLDRNARISEMTNQLDGYRMEITLPDDPDRYVVGRVSVRQQYSDMAHAAVTVTATCEPWRYSRRETCIALEAAETARESVLPNTGRRVLIPTVTVTGGPVHLTCNGLNWNLTEGEYRLLDLQLKPGYTPITYSGSGQLAITYREAIL